MLMVCTCFLTDLTHTIAIPATTMVPINGSFQGGIGLEFMASERNCFEIMWQHQSTHAPTTYLDLGSFGLMRSTQILT
jgi:hypothetical protein